MSKHIAPINDKKQIGDKLSLGSINLVVPAVNAQKTNNLFSLCAKRRRGGVAPVDPQSRECNSSKRARQ